MLVVFYISSHGFGHASRDVEVINTLVGEHPDIRVVVRTSVPRWFVETSVDTRIDLQSADVDTGVAQIDSLSLDEDETARRAAAFYDHFAERVEQEAQMIQALGASVVVADIPPLPIAAAAQAGVPVIALGNFTWDWIYEAYRSFDRLAPNAIPLIRDAYRHTTHALRLPFHGGFEAMREVTDIPLIARRSRHSRSEVRGVLKLGPEEVVALASFGGHGAALPYAEITARDRFTLLLTDEAGTGLEQQDRLRRISMSDLATHGMSYADLVAAADVVVTKPGYGIVSECVANGAAILYTSRGHFIEHDVLVKDMPQFLRCRFISQEDLRAGRWADAIDSLLRQPPPSERLPTNGAEVVARFIVSAATSSSRC